MESKVKKINLPPGSLKYTGQYTQQSTILELFSFNQSGYTYKRITDVEQMPDNNEVKWLNVIGLNDEQLMARIGEKYRIDRLTLEDVVHVTQRSKIDIFAEHIFTVFKMIRIKDDKIIHEHLSILLSGDTVITFQEEEGDIFDPLRERIRNGIGSLRDNESGYLFYALVDVLVDQYYEILSTLSDRIDEVESDLIEGDTSALSNIYQIRKELMLIKSAVMPLTEIVYTIMNKSGESLSENVRRHFHDIRDHLSQVTDLVMMYREMINSLYDTHMLSISTDTNRVMTTLTVFSAIFIPLTFITGFYGMNFMHLPGLASPYAFYFFTGACILIAGSMFTFFKVKKWF